MRLRNKKTGEMGELSGVHRIVVYDPDMPSCGDSILGEYGTLAELCAEWEDYKPKEPLINDEDARDAVYSWASALGVHQVRCAKTKRGFGVEVVTFEVLSLGSAPRIEFPSRCLDADVADGATYTIDELCGEEEE